VEVNNLGFAAYLVMLGHNLSRTPERDKNGKFIFNIEVEEDKSKELFLKYSTSRYCKFDAILMNLKRMMPRG
jgi:hypothetical protein